MKTLKKLIDLNFKRQNFDYLAVGVIDFATREYRTCSAQKGDITVDLEQSYFDLASVTKPLCLALAALIRPDMIDENNLLLLEHRSGLPAWGRLSHQNWQEQILSYPILASATEYSDFGALRLMLELEKKLNAPLKDLVSAYWDQEITPWQSLPANAICLPTGMRRGELVCGQVHDDNAYVINSFTSHAGLFSTIHGVCRTILQMDEKLQLLSVISSEIDKLPKGQRFVRGWDRALNPQNTLAGAGCSPHTFGHLGFTGTSIWIDAEAQLGHVILSNATIQYWYQKEGLSELRRMIGEWVWKNYRSS